MEPNNIEKQIRENLNSREIQPSAQAWDRLDAMLTVAEEKKTKHSFFSFKYIGIAASVLVFVTLGLFYFNQNDEIIKPATPVVDTEIKKENTEETIPVIESPILIKEKSNEVAVSTKKEGNIQKKKDSNQPIINASEVSIINKNQQEAIVNQVIVSPIKEEKTIKTKTVVDVYELLASVEKDRKKQAKINKTNIKVDEKSMLSEIDTELDLSFRQRVLNTVNKNYKAVKEAVANRNNE
jgi:hypothetical protein